jgi:hypothetical protein
VTIVIDSYRFLIGNLISSSHAAIQDWVASRHGRRRPRSVFNLQGGPPIPLLMRAEGLAEPVGDIVVNCTGGYAGPLWPIQITVELSANLTSRILNAVSAGSEALLLIDEPQPGGINMSNGFPYNGQVLGTPGIAAGASGSGN